MDSKNIGALLLQLRKEKNMTQQELSQLLHVSPQAVSKWERGNGVPDVGLLPRLTEVFGVSMSRLLQGDLAPGPTEVGNMKRMKFYVCPECGNILTASGGGELHCCGRKLEPLTAAPVDEVHAVSVETVEDEWYVTFRHPMTKDHYIRFAAVVATERVLLVRLYPEQGGEFRIPQMRRGKLYLCCSRDGLFEVKL
ncbi:MAG: helix-turn-helix domain-containing protein [Oscillibacter sp.]|nr:helix-turn-helix domain-containing protein [Oscillibacter sp.]